MHRVTLEHLSEHIALSEQLQAMRNTMYEPQDLPGRYGRVIKAVDHVLQVIGRGAVVGGGWAVWRHGFLGRMTQDVDIVVAADDVDEFLQAAAVSGFEILPRPQGRWPRLQHRETGVEVDLLPEGERPGTAARPAPTRIPHPQHIGASGTRLTYITLTALVELKLAAGRARDEADVVELVRANQQEVGPIREHLEAVHVDYVAAFDRLVGRATEQVDQ